jgi:putative ATP-dependent endonuclease of OLD family
MSLLLAKMQVNSNGEYLGSNAKVFSTLAIEEPEAHLHPAMQYKFLKFLKENKEQKKVRQIFISTHSTHITSAVTLDEIICLHNENGQTIVGYPGRVFPPDNKSKKYVQRFLDATRSDMLFAQKVILVEGIAEQLLMSILARYEGKSLENNHIAVINVGGRFFDHFLYLFDNTNPYTIPKKIACITDRDPERKAKSGGNFMKCYPFEYKLDMTNYEYKDNATLKIKKYERHPNIGFYSQDVTADLKSPKADGVA